MKNKYLNYFSGVFLTIIGFFLSLVSAINYNYLFAVSIFFSLFGFFLLTLLFKVGRGWVFAAFLPCILSIYAISDILFRFFYGFRVLDLII